MNEASNATRARARRVSWVEWLSPLQAPSLTYKWNFTRNRCRTNPSDRFAKNSRDAILNC
jgi:hypothetical protein